MEKMTALDLEIWAKTAKVTFSSFYGRSGNGSLSLYGKGGNYEVLHNKERVYFGDEEWKAVEKYNEINPHLKK